MQIFESTVQCYRLVPILLAIFTVLDATATLLNTSPLVNILLVMLYETQPTYLLVD